MLNLQQKLSQQQKLSPQQIQYIKLLQLPTLALEQRIKSEMESNPLLEEGLDEEEEQEERAESKEETSNQEEEQKADDEDYNWEELLPDADELYGHKARVDNSDEEERREIPMAAGVSMAEHLKDQLAFLGFSEEEELIAEQIIGSVDEDGYLRRPLESIIDDVAFNYGVLVEEEQVEVILKRIQKLEPLGIASRDLRECLMVQIEALEDDTPGKDPAYRMLDRAYKEFTMKHFDHIKRKLDIGSEELKDAYDLIQRLNPKPGEGDFTAAQNYITPDFTVRYEEGGDDFLISLNSGNTPELRVSKQYRQMLEQISTEKKRGSDSSAFDSETRNFLKTKLESAKWFINSIHQRRNTMLKVMEAIVQIQGDFFRLGHGHLRPMILKDIADIIHMDISTVSRVVNGKYVQCDFGVYELKYFFSEGLSTDSGEEISNKEVKAIIEEIIGAENKQKPLSDQKIATMLEGKGFQIARRTVTKYREQLGVPVARLRKQIILS